MDVCLSQGPCLQPPELTPEATRLHPRLPALVKFVDLFPLNPPKHHLESTPSSPAGVLVAPLYFLIFVCYFQPKVSLTVWAVT
jgi:hypothetical protein